jgi:hypothetical protein
VLHQIRSLVEASSRRKAEREHIPRIDDVARGQQAERVGTGGDRMDAEPGRDCERFSPLEYTRMDPGTC